MSYYTAIMILSWMALGILSILAWENDRLRRKDKRVLYLAYVLVAVSSLAEWLGVWLNGKTQFPKWALLSVKCADYIFTPFAGGVLALHFRNRSIWRKMIVGVLIVNGAFQLVSVFHGWTVRIDDQRHYTHGPLYNVYMLFYLLVLILIILEFGSYGKRFRRQNRISLNSVLLMAVAGILMQELSSGEFRTVYLTMILCMAMLFIHNSEFSQLEADDFIQEQHIRITTDVLTGVSSRYAYEKALKDLDSAGPLPKQLTVFSIDVNGLKAANDTLGHEAGDELIRGAACCIQKTLGQWGTCYRTGGDEFVVLAFIKRKQVSEALSGLSREAAAWQGNKTKELRLAAGFAAAEEHPGFSAEKLVSEADKAMYADKAAYYHASGRERRHSRQPE